MGGRTRRDRIGPEAKHELVQPVHWLSCCNSLAEQDGKNGGDMAGRRLLALHSQWLCVWEACMKRPIQWAHVHDSLEHHGKVAAVQ